MLPVMSREQKSNKSIVKIMQQSIRIGSYIIVPIMFGMSAAGKQLILVFLTEKWIDILPYFVLFCIGYSFLTIASTNVVALKAIGRSDLYLKTQIIKIFFHLVFLFIAIYWFNTVFAIVVGYVLGLIVELLIVIWPIQQIIGYGYINQFKDVLSTFILSFCMSGLVYLIGQLGFTYYILLPIQIISGILFYIGISYYTGNSNLKYITQYLNFKKFNY
jgi:O-antigen/teichoic acid export membrane protein